MPDRDGVEFGQRCLRDGRDHQNQLRCQQDSPAIKTVRNGAAEYAEQAHRQKSQHEHRGDQESRGRHFEYEHPDHQQFEPTRRTD